MEALIQGLFCLLLFQTACLNSARDILKSAKAQEDGVRQVAAITESIVVISEQTAAGTEEIASSATELSAGMEGYKEKVTWLRSISENLKSGVSQFKLS